MINKELKLAIDNNDINSIVKLFKNNKFLNECFKDEGYNFLDYAINKVYEESISPRIVYVLIQNGIHPNAVCTEKSTPLQSALWYEDTSLAKTLLEYGANPNIKTDEIESPLLASIYNLDTLKILLSFGAHYNLGIPGMYLSTNILHDATRSGNIKRIKLLLDYGADPLSDEEGYMIDINVSCQDLVFDDIKITQEECQEIKTLLNPNNPPYLKLGESDEDKYIIYENKIIQPEGNYLPYAQPYLLANKQKHPNKKYLYADNKSDAFVYWAYMHNLLTEPLEKVIEKYITLTGEVNAKNIGQLMLSTLGNTLTADMFNEEGKPFAISYPTVTHWWYNLHTDFNRLYQDEDNRLPRAIKSQEEFDTLMKLLDIRYAQFKSGKDFNSNQNKAELQALIEGKEPPKREVDLSWLEEHCGEDDMADNGVEIEKSENNNTNKDNIIPDDFFIKK